VLLSQIEAPGLRFGNHAGSSPDKPAWLIVRIDSRLASSSAAKVDSQGLDAHGSSRSQRRLCAAPQEFCQVKECPERWDAAAAQTAITDRTPHRSVRALPAHTALVGMFGCADCASPYDASRMTRGRDGSLLLILYDSSIHYSTPVLRAHQTKTLLHKSKQTRGPAGFDIQFSSDTGATLGAAANSAQTQ